MSIRIKVCCIQNEDELNLAVRCGANALGFVSQMPSGPGVISLKRIAELSSLVPPGITSFLLSSLLDGRAIAEELEKTRTQVVQLVDRVPFETYGILRKLVTGIKIVQVVHVTGYGAIDEANCLSDYVDAILLDSGKPDDEQKVLGGTGLVHDWSISKDIVETIEKPVYLAGGLSSGNVADAIRKIQPFGVDVCTGVRVDGRLNETKLRDFVDTCLSFT